MVINYACSSVYSAILVEVFQSYIGVIIQGKVLRTLFVIMDELQMICGRLRQSN